jgi:hypothetical protein
MPLVEKGVRGEGRQPLSPPQHTETPDASSIPAVSLTTQSKSKIYVTTDPSDLGSFVYSTANNRGRRRILFYIVLGFWVAALPTATHGVR